MNYLRVFLCMIFIRALPVHANELKSIKQNILENNAIDENGTVWNDLPLLPMELIASFALYDHPIVPFILERTDVYQLTMASTGTCSSAAFSATGDRVIAAIDTTAQIFDANFGHCIKILEGHEGMVRTADLNRVGDKAVTGSQDKSAKIWDVLTGRSLVTLIGHTGEVRSALFNGVGDKVLTTSDDYTAKVWDSDTGICLITLKRVKTARYNTVGDKMITTNHKIVKIWDTDTGTCIKKFREDSSRILSAVFNGNCDKVLMLFWDGIAKVWNVDTGMCFTTTEKDTERCDHVSAARFNKNGDMVTTRGNKNVKIWDTTTGKCIKTLKGHRKGQVVSAEFNEVGDRVVTASQDRTVRIWNISTLVKLQKYFSRSTGITLNQVVILDAIYEVIKDIHKERFDFTNHEHLQDDFDHLPTEVQDILYPFLKKSEVEIW